jgi:hypothetical protein
MTYHAEIRDLATRQFSCTCTDFRINGLGTCKHIEALLLQLARGVLDGGELDGIQLKSGRQALLKRLEQIMASVPTGATAPPPPPSDPAAHFAAAAKAQLGARLVECRETWLPGSDVPLILTVVDSDVPAHRPHLEPLFANSGWQGPPPRHHLLDRTAWEALQNLVAAGMITIHTRAHRPLLPDPSRPALTPEQLEKIRTLRATAEKKRRAAAALQAADLPEEAAPLAQAAEEAEAQAAEIEAGAACLQKDGQSS